MLATIEKVISYCTSAVNRIQQFFNVTEKIVETNKNIDVKTELLNERIKQLSDIMDANMKRYESDIEIFKKDIVEEFIILNSSLRKLSEEFVKINIDTIANENQSNTVTKRIEYPKTFTCDNLTSLDPLGFVDEKIKESYTDGIFVIKQFTSTKAKLSINDDLEVQKRVFGSLNDTIAPACETLVPVHFSNRILTVISGILKKENNIWRITQKMKIKLIKNEGDDF